MPQRAQLMRFMELPFYLFLFFLFSLFSALSFFLSISVPLAPSLFVLEAEPKVIALH